MDPVLLLAALLTGLAGAGHCAGMCGGIAGALAFAVPAERRQGPAHLLMLLAMSGGRISLYVLLGAVAGGLAALVAPAEAGTAMLVLRLLTALALLLVALHLLGIARSLRWLEQAGARAWQRLAPLSRRLLPLRGPGDAWLAGAIWGLLPCGLVYGALLYAAGAGSAAAGAAVMAAFGLGTLPAVLGLGLLAAQLRARAAGLRLASGALLLAYALATLLATLLAWPAILDGTCRSPGDVWRYSLGLLAGNP